MFVLNKAKKIKLIAIVLAALISIFALSSCGDRTDNADSDDKSQIVETQDQDRVDTEDTEIKKTISFDLRTSLYTDPINYSFIVTAKNHASTQDYLMVKNKKALQNRLIMPLKQMYSQTIK